MKMTEAEAKGKVCPTTSSQGSYRAVCCASKCMAWRWVPKAASWVEGDKKVQEITRAEGYCGLAGVWS